MKALVLADVGRVEIEERPTPQPGADEVLLAVDACGICGSDVHGFLGEEPRRRPRLCLGHEVVGRLASPHPTLAEGTRVAVNPLMPCGQCDFCRAGRTNNCPERKLIGLDQVQGAFADYTVVRQSQVHPLPDQVTDAAACLIEPLACAVHLLRLAPATPFQNTVLYGGGPLGLMALLVARRQGHRVTVVEPSPGRRAMALALGADAVSEPGAEGEGYELALDCTGVSPARTAAVAATRPGGTILLLGTTAVRTELEFRDIVRRELCLQASYGFTADDFRRAQGLVEAGAVAVEPWVRTLPLSAGQAAFESLTPPPDDVVKVLLKPVTEGC